MKLYRLTIDDYDDMLKLWSTAGLPIKPKGRDSKHALTRQAELCNSFFLGASEDEKLVGAAIITSDGRKGWINRLAVDPAYRRRGTAQALIVESEKILVKHGIRLFCVLIDDDNIASKCLFRKCGYVEHHDIIYFSKRNGDEV